MKEAHPEVLSHPQTSQGMNDIDGCVADGWAWYIQRRFLNVPIAKVHEDESHRWISASENTRMDEETWMNDQDGCISHGWAEHILQRLVSAPFSIEWMNICGWLGWIEMLRSDERSRPSRGCFTRPIPIRQSQEWIRVDGLTRWMC